MKSTEQAERYRLLCQTAQLVHRATAPQDLGRELGPAICAVLGTDFAEISLLFDGQRLPFGLRFAPPDAPKASSFALLQPKPCPLLTVTREPVVWQSQLETPPARHLASMPFWVKELALGIIDCGRDTPFSVDELELLLLLTIQLAPLVGPWLASAHREQSVARRHASIHPAPDQIRSYQLESAIEHLPMVVAIIDRNGEPLHVNAAGRQFATRFGAMSYLDWRMVQRSITITNVDGSEVSQQQSTVVRAFAGEHPPPVEIWITSGDGKEKIAAMIVGAPLQYNLEGEVEVVLIAFQDVTELRDLATAKDHFLQVASHELRSPITALRASTALLELDPSCVSDAARRRTILGRIDRQVDRLTRLVDQLIDSTRVSSQLPLQFAHADLVEIAREGIQQATALTPKRQVELQAAASIWGEWDTLRLEQVVVNLVSNGLRYSADDQKVTVAARLDGEHAELQVIDHGIGVPAEQIDKLFTPFFRASNACRMHRGGLGLGLHITADLVRRHGGSIAVHSASESGTVFTVRLPIRATTASG